MNKKNRLFQVVFSGCCALVLLGILIVALVQNQLFKKTAWEIGELVVIKEETLTGEVGRLQVDWPSGGVSIFKAPGDQVVLVEKARDQGAQPRARVSASGERLKIDTLRKWRPFFFDFGQRGAHYLEIYLPEKIYQEIAIDGASGSYIIDDLQMDHLSVDLSSGDVLINQVRATKAEFDLSSGKIQAENFQSDSLDMDMSSGQLAIAGRFKKIALDLSSGKASVITDSLPTELAVEVTSGEADISIPDNGGFEVKVDKTSGKFESNFSYQVSGQNHVYKAGGPSYEVDIQSGKVTLDSLD